MPIKFEVNWLHFVKRGNYSDGKVNEVILVYRKQIIFHQVSIMQVLWHCNVSNTVIGFIR